MRPNSGSDTPLIAERKQQSRPMMQVTETIRRTSVLLSSEQTNNVMGFQGNRYKETERRIVNVSRKTLPTDSENVLDYLISTVRKPQMTTIKKNNVKTKSGTMELATTEIALLSQESSDFTSQIPPAIDEFVVDELKPDSNIELTSSDLTWVSNKPGLRRKSVPTNRLSPTGEK